VPTGNKPGHLRFDERWDTGAVADDVDSEGHMHVACNCYNLLSALPMTARLDAVLLPVAVAATRRHVRGIERPMEDHNLGVDRQSRGEGDATSTHPTTRHSTGAAMIERAASNEINGCDDEGGREDNDSKSRTKR